MLPNRLRELLRQGFTEAERLRTYAVGPISWLPAEGVFEDQSFHENDGPYYLAANPDGSYRGLSVRPPAESGFDYGRRLFTPAFTIMRQQGPCAHLLYTHHPSEAELAAIGTFFGTHAYTVWLADLLDGEAVRVLEIASR